MWPFSNLLCVKCVSYRINHCLLDRVVEYVKKKSPDFFTISPAGVTSWNKGEDAFVPLNRWEYEWRCYRKLVRIPTFFLFRKWKAFRVWRTNVRSKNMKKHRSSLQKHLFIANEVSVVIG